VLGYGEFGNGTNLREQDLVSVVTANLTLAYDDRLSGHRVRLDDDVLVVSSGAGDRYLALDVDKREAARRLDAALGLDGRLAALYADVRALRTGEVRFEFGQPSAFFDRVAEARTRPDVVAAMRGRGDRSVPPDVVEEFVGADPTDPEALATGLVRAFREEADYDIPRYAAGAIEDNVIFGAADLRQHFEHDVSYEAMLSSEPDTGMFCWEFAVRSMEAFQTVAPWNQVLPVGAAYVRDARHKHAYTGLVSAVRADGTLVVPMTFLDYTHSTLYDDLHLTALLGEGLAAYNSGHRADEIFW